MEKMSVPEGRGCAEVTMRCSNGQRQTKHLSLMRGMALEQFECTEIEAMIEEKRSIASSPVAPRTGFSERMKRTRHLSIRNVLMEEEKENEPLHPIQPAACNQLVSDSKRVKRTRHSSIGETLTEENNATASKEDHQKLQRRVAELEKKLTALKQKIKDDALLHEKARKEDFEELRITKEQLKNFEERDRRLSELELKVEHLTSLHKPKPLPPLTTKCCPETDMSALAQGADGDVVAQQATP